MRSTILALLALLPVSILADEPNARPPVFKQPDPAYRHSAGDEAVVLMDGTPAATSRPMLDNFAKYRAARDRVGMDREINAGNVLVLPRETPILILQVYKPARIVGNGPRGGIPLGQMGQAANLRRDVDGSHAAGYPVEGRIASGPHADKVVFLAKEDVGRLVEVAPPRTARANPKKSRPAPKAAPPRVVAPAIKAADYLQLGKNLKSDGNRAGAAEYFRKAIDEADDSPAGKEAAALLAAMGGK